ncbi:kinase-like protein [Macrolepiota fuliginosa MF-IS2]|uniref:Kinase-like protein n=1 Tax=Macrolepiota fuliginosa MF-IS2 TaxID=1400762 RepID=A0A9P6C5R1_9AGAR|nr:kinase-like protein [Macrolepiota fuliginosa MF-IS2]
MQDSRFRHVYAHHHDKSGVEIQDPYFSTTRHTNIHIARWNGTTVALKDWRPSKKLEDEPLEEVLKEFSRQLDKWKAVSSHRNILGFHGLVDDQKQIPMLIMPQMKWNILQFSRQHPHADKLVLMHQLSSALRYLHSQQPPIVHGDVKGTNIFISGGHQLLLSDIGMTTPFLNPEVSAEWNLSENCRWQAPELLIQDNGSALRTPCDVWSFGMTALHVFTGNKPFDHIHVTPTVLMNITAGAIPQRPAMEVIDDDLWEILQNCWKFDPSMRPSMDSILPWIRLVREKQRT